MRKNGIAVITALAMLTACGDQAPQPDGSGSSSSQAAQPTSSAAAPAVSSTADSSSASFRNVYFGNLHVHTQWSFDAAINGAMSDPDAAYRWAKGEPIKGGADGASLQIKVPLDWYIVSDHAEYMGALPLMKDPNSPISQHPLARAILGDDAAAAFNAYSEILDGISNQRRDPILGDPSVAATVWSQAVEIADRHYEPGRFTTMAGFEWTSNPGWRNLHRIVFFKDTARVPDVPFSSLDSEVPETLWQWMDAQRAGGNDLLAIPHNGNASDGLMFPIEKSYGGSEFSLEYSSTRMRNEPVYEITQIKGTSETHPLLSPNDEFGSFELWDYTLASTATPPLHKRGGYARDALVRGLLIDQKGYGNPFKYGFIGDSDTHNSAASIEEDNYTGKFGFESDPKHRLQGPPGVSDAGAKQIRHFSSGGVAAVWASENTREAIFEAIRRKETYATSGPRMKIRFFAGFGIHDDLLGSREGLQRVYESGVPMGGDLGPSPDGAAPVFLVRALKEAEGANLDRIQIIKGWVDADGTPQERIYNVALSDGRQTGADGSVPSVGNTVDENSATYTNSIGDAELAAMWTDPDFDPLEFAVYYARVIEIPTPRWSTFDAARHGLERPNDLPVSIQERAWTSPIWYTPR